MKPRSWPVIVAAIFFVLSPAGLRPLRAQTTASPPAATSEVLRLVELLKAKKVLSEQEAAEIARAGSEQEASQRLAALLVSKGVLSVREYAQLTGEAADPPAAPAAAAVSAAPPASSLAVAMPAPKPSATAPAAQAPAVVPAFVPLRVLPVGPVKRESVPAVVSVGPLRLQPYGFIKMNVIHDTSEPTGDDWPPPGFFGTDSGPNAAPEFHLNARSTRLGTRFEWLDNNKNLTLTGDIEFDFEGDFTRVDNRNASTIRSSQPSLRLAYTRMDYQVSPHLSVFGLFGQDWSPFCSSTLSVTVETMLIGGGYGDCWERVMQTRTGFSYNFGGSRNVTLQPEFAITYPGLGGNPTLGQGNGLGNQLGYGERLGADSNKPEFQSRLVVQFQLDRAPGVAPAQLVASGMIGRGEAVVLGSQVPAAFLADFPHGARTGFRTAGVTAEAQLPTRWVTVQGKWYQGQALRYYFAGDFLNTFNDTQGLLSVVTTPDIDGAVTVAFGCAVPLVSGVCPAGQARLAPLEPVRAVGGFGELIFPLSRLFGADPNGRNAGWTLALHYSIDQARARDLRRVFATTGGRYKNDWAFAQLQYKMNRFVTFIFEEGYYRTRAISGLNGQLPLFRGLPARSWHNNRSQFATLFTF